MYTAVRYVVKIPLSQMNVYKKFKKIATSKSSCSQYKIAKTIPKLLLITSFFYIDVSAFQTGLEKLQKGPVSVV